jgi:murein L,D-transpeptidase YafK
MRLFAIVSALLIASAITYAENKAPAPSASPSPAEFKAEISSPSAKSDGRPKTAILVDKKTNMLYLTEYVDGEYKVLKEYHATLGQVKGDKEDEGDMKTPEGIYTFKALRTAPGLARKFGSMAFPLNFPNTYDVMAGHNGSGVMLHATDTPDRLNQNYDSLGCIVVNDNEIKEIFPHIRLGLTPILVFPELTAEYMKPGQDTELKAFFQSWIKSWETKDLDDYITHYHTDFNAQGMSKDKWKSYKGNLNKRYSSIEIGPEDVLYYRHPKYSMITFTQNYRSKLKGGGWGHRSRGTKILYIAEEGGKPKIIAETYTTLMW